MKNITRREFLTLAGAGGIFLSHAGPRQLKQLLPVSAVAAAQSDLDPRQPTGFINPLRIPSEEGGLLGIFQPTGDFTMTARVIDQEILPGRAAPLWVYEVEQSGKRFLNPTIRLETGSLFAPTFVNSISQHSIIHWHGFIVDHKNDGHPGQVVDPGQSYAYNFRVANRAGTYWYHPHPHGLTALQVYSGLSGLYVVEDDEEDALRKALDLQLGETDIPLVIQDRRFSGNGSLLYNPSRNDFFMGFLGDVLLANLTVKPFLDVSTRVYRFRILNGSNARNYRLAFQKGSEPFPFYVIGNDGGLLDRPYQVSEAYISVAERLDILLDLRDLSEGDTVFLKSLGVDLNPMHPGHHPGPLQPGSVRSEDEVYIVKLQVNKSVTYDKSIPAHLSDVSSIDTSGASTRPFLLSGTTTQWFINGWTFRLNQIPVMVDSGATEIWEITNSFNSMPHPMHIHGYQFQVLKRTGSPDRVGNLAVDENGLLPTDRGWKDTVLVWPGETVQIAISFSGPFSGPQLYLFHCHILEHEDGGMMINYQVT